MDSVRDEGDAAVSRWTSKFDKVDLDSVCCPIEVNGVSTSHCAEIKVRKEPNRVLLASLTKDRYPNLLYRFDVTLIIGEFASVSVKHAISPRPA